MKMDLSQFSKSIRPKEIEPNVDLSREIDFSNFGPLKIPKENEEALGAEEESSNIRGLSEIDDIVNASWQEPFCAETVYALVRRLRGVEEDVLHEALDRVLDVYEAEAFHTLLVTTIALGYEVLGRHLQRGLILLTRDVGVFAILHSRKDVLKSVLEGIEPQSYTFADLPYFLFFAIYVWRERDEGEELPDKTFGIYRRIYDKMSVENAGDFVCVALITTLVDDSRFDPLITREDHKMLLDLYSDGNHLFDFYLGMEVDELLENVKYLDLPHPIKGTFFCREDTEAKRHKGKKRTKRKKKDEKGFVLKTSKLDPDRDLFWTQTLRTGELIDASETVQDKNSSRFTLASIPDDRVPEERKGYWIEQLTFLGFMDRIIKFLQSLDMESHPDAMDFWVAFFWGILLSPCPKKVQEVLKIFPNAEKALMEHGHVDIASYLKLFKDDLTIHDLEATANVCLKNDLPRKTSRTDFVFNLLKSFPALGVLVSRGEIFMTNEFDADVLMEAMEDAKSSLGLDYDDPIFEKYELFLEKNERSFSQENLGESVAYYEKQILENQKSVERLSQELEALQSTNQKVRAQNRALKTQQNEVEDVESVKRQVRVLKSQLKFEHYEQQKLKKQLEEKMRAQKEGEDVSHSTQTQQAQEADRERESNETEHFSEPKVLRFPIFGKDFQDSMKSHPQKVQAQAMRLVGLLASGDSKAFEGVKKMKLVKLWSARAGLSYRLIFEIQDDKICFLELIHRKELDGFLKRRAHH
jgi:mRNA-degrading endonuclease RelE of RelBE toxin-antitoxin system